MPIISKENVEFDIPQSFGNIDIEDIEFDKPNTSSIPITEPIRNFQEKPIAVSAMERGIYGGRTKPAVTTIPTPVPVSATVPIPITPKITYQGEVNKLKTLYPDQYDLISKMSDKGEKLEVIDAVVKNKQRGTKFQPEPAIQESTKIKQPFVTKSAGEYPIHTEIIRQFIGGMTDVGGSVGLGLEAIGEGIKEINSAEQLPMTEGEPLTFPVLNRVLIPLGERLKSTGKTVADYWADAGEQFEQSKDIQGNIVDNPKLLANPKWWASNVSRMSPSLGAAIMAGIASGTGAAMLVGGTAGGLMEGAGTRRSALQKGMTEEDAIDAGAKMALASGILNAISIGKILNPSARKALTKFLVTGSVEGLTEAAEEPAEGLIFGENWKVFRERLKDAVTVAPIAAMTGGVAGVIMRGGKPITKTEPHEEIYTKPRGVSPLVNVKTGEAVVENVNLPITETPTMPSPKLEKFLTIDKEPIRGNISEVTSKEDGTFWLGDKQVKLTANQNKRVTPVEAVSPIEAAPKPGEGEIVAQEEAGKAESYYHGTNRNDIASFVDSKGNLHLKPEESFEGKQKPGISFAPTEEISRDYASRSKEPSPLRSQAQGMVFKIDKDEIDKYGLKQEAQDEFRYIGNKEIIIPKGKYEVIRNEKAISALQNWEDKTSDEVSKISDEELAHKYANTFANMEMDERRGGEEAGLNKIEQGISQDIVIKYGRHPKDDFYVEEMKKRVKDNPELAKKMADYADQTEGMPYSARDYILKMAQEEAGKAERDNIFIVDTAFHGTSSKHAGNIREMGFLPSDKHGMPTATVQPNGISLTIDPKVAKDFGEAVSNFTKGSKPEVLEVDTSKLKIYNDPNDEFSGFDTYNDFIDDIKAKGYDAVKTDTGEGEIYVFNIDKLKLKEKEVLQVTQEQGAVETAVIPKVPQSIPEFRLNDEALSKLQEEANAMQPRLMNKDGSIKKNAKPADLDRWKEIITIADEFRQYKKQRDNIISENKRLETENNIQKYDLKPGDEVTLEGVYAFPVSGRIVIDRRGEVYVDRVKITESEFPKLKKTTAKPSAEPPVSPGVGKAPVSTEPTILKELPPGITPAKDAVVRKKVASLGSIAKVKEFYSGETQVAQHANKVAEEMFGKEKTVIVGKQEPIAGKQRDYEETWDQKLKLGRRVEFAMKSGWVLRNGQLSKLGEKISESKWDKLSTAAQRILKNKIDTFYKGEEVPAIKPPIVLAPTPKIELKGEPATKTIAPGDWITDGIMRGQVTGEGTLGKVPTWKIDKGGGEETFIPKSQAKLWTKGEFEVTTKEPWQMTKSEFHEFFPTPEIGVKYTTKDGVNLEIVDSDTDTGLGTLWTLKNTKTGETFTSTTPNLNMRITGAKRATTHKGLVSDAIEEGKTVPPEVLAEYSDLVPKSTEITPQDVGVTKAEEKGLSPKEQKEYLLKEIDLAIDKLTPQTIKDRPEKDHEWALNNIKTGSWGDERSEGRTTIHVPNDGEYTLDNSLKGFLQFRDAVTREFPSKPLEHVKRTPIKEYRTPIKKSFDQEKLDEAIKAAAEDKTAEQQEQMKVAASRSLIWPVVEKIRHNWEISRRNAAEIFVRNTYGEGKRDSKNKEFKYADDYQRWLEAGRPSRKADIPTLRGIPVERINEIRASIDKFYEGEYGRYGTFRKPFDDFLDSKKVYPGDYDLKGKEGYRRISEEELSKLAYEYIDKYGYGKTTGQREIRFYTKPSEKSSEWYYSQMQRVLTDRLPNKGTGNGFKTLIRSWANKGEFKSDELDWSGLMESSLLKQPNVMREEVVKWLDENKVKVEVVRLGGGEKLPKYDIRQIGDSAFYNIYDSNGEKVRSGDTLTSALLWVDHMKEISKIDYTKFNRPDLVIPGGENYSEIFVTVPFNRVKREDALKRIAQAQKKLRSNPSDILAQSELKEANNDYDINIGWNDGHADYINIANPIVRIRINDRVDSDGAKILFVEEMQPPTKSEQAKMPVWAIKRWREIGAKKILRYAAEGGYDKIAWTTGEMQIERYDLSKLIDRVEYTKDGKLIAYDKRYGFNDVEVISEFVSRDKIEDYVGEDVAEKLNAQPEPTEYKSQVVSGLDLKVGGEGLVRIYNQDLPNVFNALSKKWGGKVGETEIPVADKGTVTVHSLDITPNMRSSVLKGQPLFKIGQSIRPSGTPAPETEFTHQDVLDTVVEMNKVFVTKTRVAATIEDLPEENGIRTAAIREEKNGNMVLGMYHEGEVWVVAKNIRSREEAITVIIHEQVGHLGFRLALKESGQDFEKFLDFLNTSTKYSAEIKVFAEKNKIDDPLVAADEWFAEKAQSLPENSTLWQRFLFMVKKWLRSKGVKWESLKWGKAELVELLQRSREVARRGGEEAGAETVGEAPVRFSGYDWNRGKSNNAVDAEAMGRFPASVVAKKLGIPIELVRESGTEEYHHTGKFFKATDYFDMQDVRDWLANKDNAGDIQGVLDKLKARKQVEPKIYTGHTVSWLEWSGTRAHPKSERVTYENATIEDTGGKFLNITLPNGKVVKKGIETKEFKIDGLFPENFLDAEKRKAAQKGGEEGGGGVRLSTRVDQTETPEFKEWFGASKVVDENGKPLVVYHGTTFGNITQFLPDGGNKETSNDTLQHYRKAKENNEKYGYMNFRSGIFFSPDPEYAAHYTGENTGTMYPVYIKAENPVYMDMRTKKVSGIDPNKTPDALILRDGGEILEVAVIDPTQIKSIFGNTGIRYSKKPAHGFSFSDAETEKRFNASRGVEPEGVFADAINAFTKIKHLLEREYEHLPNTKEFAQLKFDLLRLAKQKPVASDKATRELFAVTQELDTDQYDLFTRKVILDDLIETLAEKKQLPFGFTEDSLIDDLNRLDELVDASPEINAALKKREAVWEELKANYIKAQKAIGFNVDKRLKRKNYFRHQVLEYAQAKSLFSAGEKLRTPSGRGFLKKRHGSLKDINTDYVQAEHEVMAQMAYDIEVANTIKSVMDNYDKLPEIKKEVKKYNEEHPESPMVWEEAIPEGYTTWQPREGHVFYMTNTISEKIAQSILEGSLDELGIEPEMIHKALAVGGDRLTLVVKNEVANTLENLTQGKTGDLISVIDRRVLNAWKQWQLISPTRWIKYNLRNTTGDAEAVLVGAPQAFRKVPEAIRDLLKVFRSDKPLERNIKDWQERGGSISLLQAQEMDELTKLTTFTDLYEKTHDLNVWKKYWRAARMSTDFRESILRYAAYLQALEEVGAAKTGKLNSYWASTPNDIDGLSDVKDKAFWMSNDLLGAYDRVSVFGQWFREHAFSFWSWKEVNFNRYQKLWKNAIADDRLASATGRKILGKVATSPFLILKIGKFVLGISAMLAAVQAWNNLYMQDEEDDLPDSVKKTVHVTLGRDKNGDVMYFNRIGMLNDMLELVSLDDGLPYLNDLFHGKKGVMDIVREMAKTSWSERMGNMARAPINLLIQGSFPFVKMAGEAITRRSLFPDFTHPGTIRDRGLNVARNFGLANEYTKLMGLPTRGYIKGLSQNALYKSVPGESAYYDILQAKTAFEKKQGRAIEQFYISPKGNALYNYKLAIKYGDKKASVKYLALYMKFGGSIRGINQSVRMMSPEYGLKGNEHEQFKTFINNDTKLLKAIEYYDKLAENIRGSRTQSSPKPEPSRGLRSIYNPSTGDYQPSNLPYQQGLRPTHRPIIHRPIRKK